MTLDMNRVVVLFCVRVCVFTDWQPVHLYVARVTCLSSVYRVSCHDNVVAMDTVTWRATFVVINTVIDRVCYYVGRIGLLLLL